MLEKLDQIDWVQLTHAYGPAGDVPGLIRDLTLSDYRDREQAIEALYGNIWHQGTVYQASAYAVPFLAELLRSDDVRDKHEILFLLQALATGHSYIDVHQHSSLFQQLNAERMKTPEWQEELAQELAWVKKTADAVKLEKPAYIHLLADSNAAVRDAAACLLATLGGPDRKTADEIQQRLSVELDETVRASLLLTFGCVCDPEGPDRDFLVEVLSRDQSKAARLVAAVSLMKLAPERLPDAAVQIFLDSLQRPDDYSLLQNLGGLKDQSVVSFVSRYARLLRGPAANQVEEFLATSLPEQRGLHAFTLGEVLLALVFPEPVSPGASLSSLNQRQLRVLQSLAASEDFWGVQIGDKFCQNVDTSFLMRDYGLPQERTDVAAFLRAEKS